MAQPTQTAQTVTVWEDRRNDATGTDIYIQSIDNSTGVPQWVAAPVNADAVKDRFDGMAVCRAANDQRNPRAAYDGMNGVIVVWEDYRNDPTLQVAEIWAQRIDLLTGLPDPAWPLDGIPVCQTGYHAERPRIAGTMDGAFITWIDHRNNLWSPVNRDVYVQYIKSASATFPPPPTNWIANGISVSANPQHDQINPELDVDNIVTLDMLGLMTQGVVITYQDDRYLGATSGMPVWSVFVNRISADGNQLYTFGGLGGDVAVDASTGEHQRLPRVVTTGKQPYVTDRRAIVVWEDDVGGGASSTDIYFQAISNLGFSPNNQPGQPYWQNSTPVCTAPGVQTGPIPVLFEYFNQISQTYIPYVTVGWEDYRDYAVNGIDLYGGLIDAITPAVVNPGAMNGDIISALPYDQTQLSMDNIGLSSSYDNTVFVWKHFNGVEANIHYQKIYIPGWMLLQPLHGFPVTEAKADQVLPQANKEVFVWQDGRRDPIPGDNQDDENIYAQTPGECTGPTGMKWRDKFAYWTYGHDAQNYRMASDTTDGTTYVVWDEERYPFGQPGDAARIVFIQKFDKDGVPRWSNNGVALSIYNVPGVQLFSLNASLPDVCIDGAGGARVVWQQQPLNGNPTQVVVPVHINALATIDYASGGSWLYYGSPIIEPRITAINDVNHHAVVAGIVDYGGGRREAHCGLWTVKNNVVTTPIQATGWFPNQPGWHTDLNVMYDGVKYVYILTNDVQNSNIDITCVDRFTNISYQNNVVAGYNAFGGHDLNLDNNDIATGSAALVAYSYQQAPGAPFDVYFRHCRLWTLSAPVQLTNNAVPTDSKYPAIASDNVFNIAEMGALIAWDTKYTVPGTSWIYHKVESNRVAFPGPTTVFPANFQIAAGLPGPSYPDITRVINQSPGNYSPRGVVVWEGGGESSPCSLARPVEIYAQYMDYDPASGNIGAQWPQPEMVGPGPGNYMQTGPTVKQSIPSTVAVFWDDTQTGNNGIMGTRMDVGSTVIDWAKRTRDEALPIQPGQLTIIDIWPQPAHSGCEVAISLHADVDATVSFELYDLLGRRIAVLYSGFMERSELTVRFSPSAYDLNTGTYLLRARSEEGQTSRTITVVR
ncbi:T9SS type A sorting domain-containing protein [bacterium]|nr:T9SS type A sorting domain-containing protein [bacterium]